MSNRTHEILMFVIGAAVFAFTVPVEILIAAAVVMLIVYA